MWKNRKNAKQLICYDDIVIKNATPTDIDGILEYHNTCYVIYEFKYKSAVMKEGQRKCLERIADDLQKAGKETAVFLCEHDVDSDYDVDAAAAVVREYYSRGKWYSGKQATVASMTKRFVESAELKKKVYDEYGIPERLR